jgi:hypothetical protein
MRTPQELHRLREQAITLPRQGKSLRQIKEILGPMSNSALHDALRGEPQDRRLGWREHDGTLRGSGSTDTVTGSRPVSWSCDPGSTP